MLAPCRCISNSSARVVLGIESSCDDTGVAIVRSDGTVLGEAIATQADIHAQWGGVVPKLAQEAHQQAIDRVVDEALQQSGLSPSQLDAVAVTIGPGLSLCLQVGVRKARQIAHGNSLPLVEVHHMEAHALVARMAALQQGGQVEFPFLCLLVSGGHNLLVLVQGVGRYMQLGTTIDDALGEAYDKVARMLGLEMKPHGGAALEALARGGDPKKYPFVVPLRRYKNCDFSYAGLKTAARMAIEKLLVDPESAEYQQIKADIAASFQYSAVRHLRERATRAIEWAKEVEPGLKQMVVAGGVAANQYVRAQLGEVAEEGGLELVVPPARWCTDNGVMVAWTGLERLELGLSKPPPESASDDEWIELKPRWPLTDHKHPGSMPPTKGVKQARIHAPLTPSAATN